jgi:uncharacterized lipoprotein NlpE involved in copper resistance
MKKILLTALLITILLLVGCNKQVQEVKETPAPVETAPVVEEIEVVEEVEVVEELPSASINIDTSEMSDSDKATLERYKKACDAGNAGLCAALKRMEERLGVSAEVIVDTTAE